MAILTLSAQPGLGIDEIGRRAAGALQFEFITQARIEGLYHSEFGADTRIPARGYGDLVASMVARLATGHRLIYGGLGAHYLLGNLPDVLRVWITASHVVRAGRLMAERGLDRKQALAELRRLDREHAAWLRQRFRRSSFTPIHFDVTLNAERWEAGLLAEAVVATARGFGLDRAPLLSETAERQIQFEARLRLARLGIPPPGAVALRARQFAHPSEEIFASLLDFYQIAWEYEPRSFPIDWDDQGRVVESFTPDFYLPELDLYVELTTMKQSLVTKKNRKIKRLRELYPEVNVQVFYQKDFENIIFKYGLEKTAELLKK
jgi:cytidylate kinase